MLFSLSPILPLPDPELQVGEICTIVEAAAAADATELVLLAENSNSSSNRHTGKPMLNAEECKAAVGIMLLAENVCVCCLASVEIWRFVLALFRDPLG